MLNLAENPINIPTCGNFLYSFTANYSLNYANSVTIPVSDRSLLQELVRKFGWACVF